MEDHSDTKYCPYCAETIKAAACVCRYCGRDLEDATPPPTPVVESKPATRRDYIIIGSFLLVMLMCTVAGMAALARMPAREDRGNTFDAAFVCQKRVRDRLKAPTTAKFPEIDRESASVTEDGTFVVVSYVDSENSFGAMIRTTYMCEVEYSGNDFYKIKELTFAEQ